MTRHLILGALLLFGVSSVRPPVLAAQSCHVCANFPWMFQHQNLCSPLKEFGWNPPCEFSLVNGECDEHHWPFCPFIPVLNDVEDGQAFERLADLDAEKIHQLVAHNRSVLAVALRDGAVLAKTCGGRRVVHYFLTPLQLSNL